METAKIRNDIAQDALGIASANSLFHSFDDRTVDMLRNLHLTSKGLHTHDMLTGARTRLMRMRLQFYEMMPIIDEMLEEQMRTPLHDMEILKTFMRQGAGRNYSHLYVLKALFDRVPYFPHPSRYSPTIVKLMHMAEYIHGQLTLGDFHVLNTDLRLLTPFVDVLKILFKSLFYVYHCNSFQTFSVSEQDVTSRRKIEDRRLVTSGILLTEGVLDTMLTVCTQHPKHYEFLSNFMYILTKSSEDTQRNFFAKPTNMSVLQQLIVSAATNGTRNFQYIRSVYAELMEDLYMEDADENYHRRASEHGELEVAITMITVLFLIPDMGNCSSAWKLCKSIILYMNDNTLISLYRLGHIDKLMGSEFYCQRTFQEFVPRFFAVLRSQNIVSEEDTAWIQRNGPGGSVYLTRGHP
jgi:hypothetical protein